MRRGIIDIAAAVLMAAGMIVFALASHRPELAGIRLSGVIVAVAASGEQSSKLASRY